MRSDSDPSRDLLAWYDRHARVMPWRVGPAARRAGARPDPYRVWLSEVMLQQTTVAAAAPYFIRFVSWWPDVGALARARDDDVMAAWAGLGYYARARNLLKCARAVVDEHAGRFPDTRDRLLALPGVGPYTAAAIAAIAFDRVETVVDGNVERVMARLHDIDVPLPTAKPELARRAEVLTPDQRPGDYAQAVMDLGATVCTPRKPACGICPWMRICRSRAQGTAETLPRRAPKPVKPVRNGISYIVRRVDGALLLERRPAKGLLGGMLGWPGTEWAEGAPAEAAPIRAEWRTLPEQARHTFTHFHLRLSVRTALVPMERKAFRGEFIGPDDFDRDALPSVMRKAFDLLP